MFSWRCLPFPDDETLADFANLAGAASACSGHSMIHKDFELWCVAWHVAWHLEQGPTRIFIPRACCMACFFDYAVWFAASVTQKWQKNWPSIFSISKMHSSEDSLVQCSVIMSWAFALFSAGPNTKSHPMLISGIDIEACHMANGLASPHWCGHALSNWEQNAWFEVHEKRVSPESARCCRASVISIFRCFLLLPGYWYIGISGPGACLKSCSQMIPDESCICSTMRFWTPWQIPVTWWSLWGRLRRSGTRPFAATSEENLLHLCSISEGSWILLTSYFKGCW